MSQDKYQARNFKKKCNFVYHNPDFVFPHDKVTSTGVIVFDNDKNVLVVEIHRGFDIPGGHVNNNDLSFIDAVKRETLEEAFVSIKDIKLSLVVESDYFGTNKNDLTYMLFYVAIVNVIYDFVKNNESFSRKFMKIDEFIDIYQGDKMLIENIIKSALNSL
ncbi:MAG: NUDIX domain-containing protein [Candidatus Gracilibacteria bacterium]|nr:NUDIX domain-containing protein [Candidatus Gracilibacteria bacterium]